MKNFKNNIKERFTQSNIFAFGKNSAKRYSTSGFTLIELLVVIAIIGMLAATVLTSLGAARAKGRDAKRISDLANIRTSLEIYYDSKGTLPDKIYSDALGTTNPVLAAYITKMPLDPDGSLYKYAPYKRTGGSNPTTYVLGAVLELDNPVAVDDLNKCDSQIIATKKVFAGALPSAGFCGQSSNCGIIMDVTPTVKDLCYQISNVSL